MSLEIRKSHHLESLIATIADSFPIERLFWNQDSVTLVTVCLAGAKVALYCLCSGECFVVKGGKPIEKGCDYNPGLDLLAVVVVDKASKESLSLVSAQDARLLQQFPLETKFAEEVRFAREYSWLLVRERFFASSLLVYSLAGSLAYRIAMQGSFTDLRLLPGQENVLTVANGTQLQVFHGLCFKRLVTKELGDFAKGSRSCVVYSEEIIPQDIRSQAFLNRQRRWLKRDQENRNARREARQGIPAEREDNMARGFARRALPRLPNR